MLSNRPFPIVFAGLKLLWDGVSFLEMTVPPKYRGQLCGLCGNFNGDKSDDFYGKQHTHFTDGQHFGDSWRVGGLRACSVLPQDMPHSYEPECTQSWSSRIKSDKFCNALKTTVFSTCADKVDPKYYYDACKIDMCECPGEQCHCEVLTAYARECERAGQFIRGWRDKTGCRNVTSFKYSHHRHLKPSKPNDVLHIGNSGAGSGLTGNVLHTEKSISKTTATTTTITTTTTTIATTLELPDWIKPNKLGASLPGCSRQTAEFCRYPKRSKRRKLSKAEKRRKRRKRRKRKRKQRRWRQKMLQQRKRKQTHALRAMMGLNIDDRNDRRRLQWTHHVPGGKPPFESLLSSNSGNFGTGTDSSGTGSGLTGNNQTQLEIEDYGDFDPHTYDRISSSDLLIPRKGRQRTPLPLKEAKEDQRGWKRRKRK